MQERIKLAPSQAHTYNNPAVNHLFVQATVTTILVAGASAGVALAMPWQLQNRPKKITKHLYSKSMDNSKIQMPYFVISLLNVLLQFLTCNEASVGVSVLVLVSHAGTPSNTAA